MLRKTRSMSRRGARPSRVPASNGGANSFGAKRPRAMASKRRAIAAVLETSGPGITRSSVAPEPASGTVIARTTGARGHGSREPCFSMEVLRRPFIRAGSTPLRRRCPRTPPGRALVAGDLPETPRRSQRHDDGGHHPGAQDAEAEDQAADGRTHEGREGIADVADRVEARGGVGFPDGGGGRHQDGSHYQLGPY